MSAERVEITISSLPGEQRQFPRQGRSSWLVTVDIDGDIGSVPVTLNDPFDQEQQDECRWYVEEFVCKSPYSISRARRSADALQEYAQSLQNQLRLGERFRDAGLSEPSQISRKVSISICEDGDANNSIHQIYWELLENPSSWNAGFEVTVKRIFVSDGCAKRNHRHNLTELDKPTGTLPQVNGLLVLARDLSKDSSKYEDVSPRLALQVLTRIREQLQCRGDQVSLHLEVVRPGSLEALRKHLNLASNVHGKGFYHFVHFDLHGVVDSTEGKAYLLFNDPDPEVETTRRERVDVVAEALVDHGIQVAVLNACESARAGFGNAGNIAKMFITSGVRNAVAMSSTISSSAAELQARDALRRHPLRAARLGLQRSLIDNFVPVTYSDGSDLRLSLPTAQSIGQPFDVATSAPNVAHLPFGEDEGLIGREFDLLRLEKKLLSQGKVHLTGRPGVGKTALVKQAILVWGQTSFVDLILYIDFGRLYSLDQAIRSFTSQIPMNTIKRMALRSELRHAIAAQEFDPATFNTHILDSCAKRRLIVILDGLQAFFPRYLYDMPNRPTEKSVPQLSRFVEALLSLQSAARQGQDIYHIIVSRLDDATLPLSEGLKRDLVPYRFSLPSLRLSDSIQLSQLALHNAGLNFDKLEDDDLNELELLMGHLDGNPAAIVQIVSQLPRTRMNIAAFRASVQTGGVQKSFEGPGKDLCQEIDKLFCAVGDGPRALLLLLSSFWVEGMGISTILDWAVSHKICEERKSGMILAYIQAQGLIDVGPGVTEKEGEKADIIITWIHPLITTYGRKAAHDTLAAKQSQSLVQQIPGGSSMKRTFAFFVPSLRTPGPSQVKAASLVLSVIDAPPQILLDEDIHAAGDAFVILFLREIAKCDAFRLAMTMVGGIGYRELHSFWSSQSGNLRTCLAICTRKPQLPVDEWPLDYLQFHIANIRIVGSPVQIAEYAELFEHLFEIFLELNGSLAIPSVHQMFALCIATSLSAIYQCEVLVPSKWEKYVQLALQIVAESEERFGALEGAQVTYLKGLAMRHHAVFLLYSGKHREAVSTWEQMLEVDKSVFESDTGAVGAGWSPDQIEEFTAKLSVPGTDPGEILKRLNGVSSNTMLHAFYKSRKSSLRFIRAAAGAVESGDDLVGSRQYRSILAKMGDGMEQIYKGADTMGFKGINQDPRWWPEDFDMNRFAREFEDPEARIAALENAVSSGDSKKATKHLTSLLMEAYKNFDMDEITEYMDALIKHSRNTSYPGSGSLDWEKQKATFLLYKSAIDVVTGSSTDSKAVVADTLAHQIRILKEQGASHESIEPLEISLDIWQKGTDLQGPIDAEQLRENNDRNREIMQCIIDKAKKDKNFIEVLPGINLRYQQQIQQLQEAEMTEDWSLALERLEALKIFCHEPENEFLATSSGAEWFRKLRVNYLFMQDSTPFVKRFSDALAEKNYNEAQRMLQAFETNLNPELRDRAVLPFAKWKASLESTPLEFAISDMTQLRRSGRTAEAIKAADEIIEKIELGAFEFIDAGQLQAYSYSARLLRVELHCLGALLQDSFDEVAEYIQELRQLVDLNHALAPPDCEEKIQDLEEALSFKVHFSDLVAASQTWDVEGYEYHTKGFKSLFEQQKQTPNMRRTFHQTIDRRTVLKMEGWVIIFRMWGYVKRILTSRFGKWLVVPSIGLYFAYKLLPFLVYLLLAFLFLSLGSKRLGFKPVIIMAVLYGFSVWLFTRFWRSVLLFLYFFPVALKLTGAEKRINEYLKQKEMERQISAAFMTATRQLEAQQANMTAEELRT